VRLFFVDDSGSRSEGYFCLGAYSIKPDDLRQVTEIMSDVKRQFRVARDTEVKMSHVGAESNNPLIDAGHVQVGARIQFPLRVLSLVAEVESFRSFCIGVETSALHAPKSDPVDWACQLLFERCQFLLDQEGETSALLFFDNERHRKTDIASHLKQGSYYRRTVGFTEPPSFYMSRNSPGLQVADFVAGAANRFWNHGHDTYVRLLWNNLYRQRPATPIGSGIKSFPGNSYSGL
jgi:hypothetical protein